MRTVAPMQPATRADAIRAPVPPAPLDRRTIVEEVLVVLSLSVLRSAAFAILSLLEAPIAGVVVAAADQSTEFARQVLGELFAVAGAAGVGIYLAAVAIGVNRFVLPVPPLGHWWTVPALVLNAVEAGL